jgi:DNA mismatch repair protein MutS
MQYQIHNFESRCSSVALSKGNDCQSGINDELDELRAISTSGKEFLRELKRERQRTSILKNCF